VIEKKKKKVENGIRSGNGMWLRLSFQFAMLD
jgi:hypothetical protein